MRALQIFIALLAIATFASAAPRRRIAPPHVGPSPSSPLDGWEVPNEQLLSAWLITTSTPHGDQSWSAGNTRINAHGDIELYVWRLRDGIFCRAQTLQLPAQPDQVASYMLDTTHLRAGDLVMFEKWAGITIAVDQLLATNERVPWALFPPASHNGLRGPIGYSYVVVDDCGGSHS